MSKRHESFWDFASAFKGYRFTYYFISSGMKVSFVWYVLAISLIVVF